MYFPKKNKKQVSVEWVHLAYEWCKPNYFSEINFFDTNFKLVSVMIVGEADE